MTQTTMRLLSTLLSTCCTVMLAACLGGNSSDNPSTVRGVQAAETRPNVFTRDSFLPLPAAQNNPVLTQVREQILGPGAMNPDVVQFWWVGVSSFVVSMKGHLFLLDAWEIVGMHANYVPIGREELAALQPEAIFIGHGHFDHAADAGYIAARSNAVLVAGSTVCDTARERASEEGLPANFPCLNLGDATQPGPGSTQSLGIWEDLPPVHVIQHTHSAAEPGDLLAGGAPLVYIPDVLTFPTYLNTDMGEALRFLKTLPDDGGAGQPAGGTWAYQFSVDEFSFFWHDSTGIMKPDNPTSQAIERAIRNLPECTDVQLNAIVGFGMVTSAYRDALAYVAAARPKLALPTHHDAWAPAVGGGADAYKQSWLDAVATLPKPPQVDYLQDPEDYLKVRRYSINDPRWAGGC